MLKIGKELTEIQAKNCQHVFGALINNFLKDYNYICDVYSEPLEALEQFRKNHHKYSIVILDLGLPRMDGFDLFKKLRY